MGGTVGWHGRPPALVKLLGLPRVARDADAILIELKGPVLLGALVVLVDRDPNVLLVGGSRARHMDAALLVRVEPLADIEFAPPLSGIPNRGRRLDRDGLRGGGEARTPGGGRFGGGRLLERWPDKADHARQDEQKDHQDENGGNTSLPCGRREQGRHGVWRSSGSDRRPKDRLQRHPFAAGQLARFPARPEFVERGGT